MPMAFKELSKRAVASYRQTHRQHTRSNAYTTCRYVYKATEIMTSSKLKPIAQIIKKPIKNKQNLKGKQLPAVENQK